MILVIDNYDSFVYNLARYAGWLGRQRTVVRNDAITLDQVVRSPRSRAPGWEPAFKSITANVSNVFDEWRRGRE